MTAIEKRLAALESRLNEAEDVLEIYRLFATYGPSVDSVSPESLAAMWTEHGVYDAGGFEPMVGRQMLRDMLFQDAHQGFVARGCAHVMSLPHVTVDGDTAVAIGYSRVYARRDDHWVVERLSANRWVLARTAEGWRVLDRTNRLLNGSEEARGLLTGALIDSELAS